jgi:hypothetical protein
VSALPPVGAPPPATPAPIPPPPSAPPPAETAPPPAASTRLPPRSREDREAAVLNLMSGSVDLQQLPLDADQTATPRGATPAAVYQNVINNHRESLATGCWKPAQQTARAQGKSPPPAVQLRVALKLLPDGRIEDGEAVGGSAFPGLGDCVLRSLRALSLPPSGTRQIITADVALR